MALFLREHDVEQILSMALAMQAVREAMADLARGQAINVPRERTRTPATMLHILQGALPRHNLVGYKAYTSNREGVRFLLHVYDASRGVLRAIIEANHLGMMRTGAASGVATQALARPEARIAGVIGAGWQARGQVLALAQAAEFAEIRVFARNAARLAAFCEEMSRLTGRAVVPVASAELAVTGADVVTTVTTAAQPVLTADWLAPGVHINAAGSNSLVRRELDEATIRRCQLITVDARDVALKESGDLLPLLEKGRLHDRQLVELGDVLAGGHPGRSNSAEITLFESQGMAIQDMAIAAAILPLAEQAGLGVALPIGD